MAVPSLPSALNTGDVVSNAWVDSVRAGLSWFMDDRPAITVRGRQNAITSPAADAILTSTFDTMGFGTGGAFIETPEFNIGGWTTATAEPDPEPLVVPESGIYFISVQVEYDNTDVDGDRYIALLKNGTAVANSNIMVPAAAQNHRIGISMLVNCAASQELEISVWQSSGSTLVVPSARLTAIWQMNA